MSSLIAVAEQKVGVGLGKDLVAIWDYNLFCVAGDLTANLGSYSSVLHFL